MHLFPPELIPAELQPLVTFAASWLALLLLLNELQPFRYRPQVAIAAGVVFLAYWLTYATGFAMGRLNASFGLDGVGDEILLLASFLAAVGSFLAVERRVYLRAAYCSQFDLKFTKDGPKLRRWPSLAEAADRAGRVETMEA